MEVGWEISWLLFCEQGFSLIGKLQQHASHEGYLGLLLATVESLKVNLVAKNHLKNTANTGAEYVDSSD